MAVWLVRAGRDGRDEPTCLESSLAMVGFTEIPDISGITTRDEVREIIAEIHPGSSKHQISNLTSQLYGFARGIEIGDIVALPRKRVNKIALGRVTGPYAYQEVDDENRHTRPVKWELTEIPRSAIAQDLLYSLGAFMTVCRIQRNDAENRFEQLIQGNDDPGIQVHADPEAGPEEVAANESAPLDIESLASEQIRDHIETRFKGHELTRLINEILEADGYLTYTAPPGPDGGVDILAGRGNFGLEGQKLCVQVKSSTSSCDVNVFRALQGTMQTFQANRGLLVSWGGFTKTALRESKMHFFNIRLWDSQDIIEALYRSYDRLSEDLRADLPLKRVWTMVLDD